MPLTNFVDKEPPYIVAAWLNSVDVLLVTVFDNATSKAEALTALGATSLGESLFSAANPAAVFSALGFGARGIVMAQATTNLEGRQAINAAEWY